MRRPYHNITALLSGCVFNKAKSKPRTLQWRKNWRVTVPSCRDQRHASPDCRIVTNWSANLADSRLTLRSSLTLTRNSQRALALLYASHTQTSLDTGQNRSF